MSRAVSTRSAALVMLCAAVALISSAAQSLAEGDAAADRKAVAGEWIYEDIDAAYAKAQETGKPLLVAFR